MLNQSSPYARASDALRDNGYHVLPVGPGTKVPGAFQSDAWKPMPGWSKYCDTAPPSFIHDQWERWPDAGVCIAHGKVIGLDLDTDREDVARALYEAVTPPFVRRRGAKGWMGYYRPGAGLDGLTARVRWYDDKGGVVVELLLHGTQSVLPPTIHPTTGMPYAWVTQDTLEDTAIGDLPLFSGDDLKALDREFTAIGLTRQAPKKAGQMGSFTPVEVGSRGHDLSKPHGRSVNDRAMEPAAIDQWWPAMGLPKTRQRGHGAWEAVAPWRASGSGRALHDRNPNLKIVSSGIRDFGGTDEAFTPINLICRWKGLDPDTGYSEAAEWLGQYIRAEEGMSAADMLAGMGVKPLAEVDRAVADYDRPTLAMLVSNPPSEMPDVSGLADGVLRHVYNYVREAMRREWPEAAFIVALNMTGVCIGRNFATWTNLRSNLYTVVLAKSGWGKSSIYGPAVDLLIHAGLKELIGAERIMSDSGLIQEIHSHFEHKKIYFLDEFGHMLQRCNDKGAGGHVKKIVTEFTNLYSKANGFYAGSAYADGGKQSSMECPHINIFGMATPGQFWDAFGSGAVEDGTLPRFSILKTNSRPARKKLGSDHLAKMEAARDKITPMIADLASRRVLRSGNLSSVSGALPEVIKVMPDTEAEAAFQEIEDIAEDISSLAEVTHTDKDIGGILARVAETAVKIALIFAVSRDPDHPKIIAMDMVAGRRLAWWFAHVAIEGAVIHISDSEHQAFAQRALEFIRTGDGGQRTKRDLVRKMKMKARDLDDAMKTLIDSELVVVGYTEKDDGVVGRKSQIYIALEE